MLSSTDTTSTSSSLEPAFEPAGSSLEANINSGSEAGRTNDSGENSMASAQEGQTLTPSEDEGVDIAANASSGEGGGPIAYTEGFNAAQKGWKEQLRKKYGDDRDKIDSEIRDASVAFRTLYEKVSEEPELTFHGDVHHPSEGEPFARTVAKSNGEEIAATGSGGTIAWPKERP
ncbi:hypothetical protein P7C73_g3810, partial [Tremellales sp. Uapishka_1]